MTTQQAYDLAIEMGQVQAAKVFLKKMKAELAPLETLCSSLLVATPEDYAALEDLTSSPSSKLDIWGHALR